MLFLASFELYPTHVDVEERKNSKLRIHIPAYQLGIKPRKLA